MVDSMDHLFHFLFCDSIINGKGKHRIRQMFRNGKAVLLVAQILIGFREMGRNGVVDDRSNVPAGQKVHQAVPFFTADYVLMPYAGCIISGHWKLQER